MRKNKVKSIWYQNEDHEGRGWDYITTREMDVEYEDGTRFYVRLNVGDNNYEITEEEWYILVANSDSVNELIEGIKKLTSNLAEQDWLYNKEVYYEINSKRTYIIEFKKREIV